MCGQQQSLQTGAGSAVLSFLNPFCSSLPPIIDDSLSQLRSLAGNGSVITNRSAHTPQAAVAAAGQFTGTTGGAESRQTSVASTTSGTTPVQQASLPSSRLVFSNIIGKCSVV